MFEQKITGMTYKHSICYAELSGLLAFLANYRQTNAADDPTDACSKNRILNIIIFSTENNYSIS